MQTFSCPTCFKNVTYQHGEFAGVEESPFMTWGEIEGTPFRLDGGDTPLVTHTPGPGFRIPEVPERNRLAWELAEKASKSHRKKKEEAIKSVTARLSS